MSRVSSVFGRHAHFAYAAVKCIPLLVTSVGTLVLAAILDIGSFGVYSAAVGLTQIINSVGLLGQDQLILRGLLGERQAILRSSVIAISSLTLGIFCAALILSDDVLPVAIATVVSACLIQWTLCFQSIAQSWRRDFVRARWELGLRGAYQTGLLVGGFVIRTAFGTAVLGAAGTLLGAVATFLTFLRAREHHSVVVPRNSGFFVGVGFGLPGVLYGMAAAIPVLFIAAQGSPEANAQSRIVFLVYAASASVGSAIYGEYFRVRLYQAVDSNGRGVIWQFVKRSLLVSVPIVMLLLSGVAIALPVILGEEYSATRPSLAVIVALIPAQFAAAAMGSMSFAVRGALDNNIRQAVAVVVSFLLSIALPMTAFGLSVILLINEYLGVIYYLVSARRSKGQ